MRQEIVNFMNPFIPRGNTFEDNKGKIGMFL